MERRAVRRYPTGVEVSDSVMAVPPGLPRPGFGAVYVSCDRHGAWSANWQDGYPEPDANGATYGHAEFEGDGSYEAVEAWARAQPVAERYVAYPVRSLPGTPPESRIGYQPLPPDESHV
jgi:hypothetical protein